MQDARDLLTWYKKIYGEQNVYLEVCNHEIPEQRALNTMLFELGQESSTPVVAANDTHYITREDANAQDVLLCIGSNHQKSDTNRFKFSTEEFYIKSDAEMSQAFPNHPEVIENSIKIAERCNLTIDLPGPILPIYEIPEGFTDKDDYLRHIVHEGLIERYGEITPQIRKRAEYELEIIISMDFTGYFLIVWDFIKYGHDNGIPVGPGRGSGAGSIVAYAMRITDIDPLKYNLLFERFLNPERVSMPDFDVDFCFERRGEVIEYVTRKYGRDRVGQIITFGTLKTKLVIRDVARVLGLPYDEADRIAKLVPNDLKMTLQKALEQEPELAALPDQGEAYAELIDVSRRLEGLHRHASTHAAGVVIGQKELTEYVPLYRDPKTGSISTQFTMDLLEDAGLVKMDFLGLKTLTLIRNTEALIRLRTPDFSIETIDEEDPVTSACSARKERGDLPVREFRDAGYPTTRETKPDRGFDRFKRALPSRSNAVYRPVYRFKKRRTPITYPLPSLEGVLQETYGVIVYQEQVMQIAQIVGGFSLGKADILRRAMGKKKVKVMEEMKEEFLDGAETNGYTRQQGSDIFELLEPFAGYGFNKSHAAAYSVVAYRTAFLKANYPVEFIAANLTNEINSPTSSPTTCKKRTRWELPYARRISTPATSSLAWSMERSYTVWRESKTSVEPP